MLGSPLAFAFVLGLQHAIEPDHLAAVAVLSSRAPTLRRGAMHGALWGVGHVLSLLLLGAGAILVGAIVPANLEAGLEALVGLTLVFIGARLLRRGVSTEEGPLPRRSSALMGALHGAAGSGALVVLSAQALPSPGLRVLYLALVGLGAIVGMAALAMALRLPVVLPRRLAPARRLFSLAAGLYGVGVGLHLLVTSLL